MGWDSSREDPCLSPFPLLTASLLLEAQGLADFVGVDQCKEGIEHLSHVPVC